MDVSNHNSEPEKWFFYMFFLCVPKERTKEKAPREATPKGVRSFAKVKSASN